MDRKQFMSELPLKPAAQIGTLFDSWGFACSHPDCEEFRTVGLALWFDRDDGVKKGRIYLCQQHLLPFFEEYVFARKHQRVGDIKEVENE